MKGKRFFSVWTMALLLVIALGAMAVGYGAWTDRITVGGTAKTGTLNVWWESVTPTDGDGGGPGACLAWAEAGSDPRDALKVLLTNGYPSYHCEVHGVMKNIGSLPAKVKTVDWTVTWADWVGYTVTDGPTAGDVIAVGATDDLKFTVEIKTTPEPPQGGETSGEAYFDFEVSTS